MKSILSKVLTSVLIVAFFAACTQTVTYLSPKEGRLIRGQSSVLVEKTDGETVRLKNPFIENEQLVGATKAQGRVRIDFASIRSVKIEKKKTGLAYLYSGAAVVLAWLAIGAATAPSPPSGSCPYIYSFDGKAMHLDAEPYGAALCEGLKRSEWSVLEHLKAVGGAYRLRIANELRETEYTDELRLLVVDHPAGLRIVPDAAGGLHTISALEGLLTARDARGTDIAARLAARDDIVWETDPGSVDLAVDATLRDELTVEFPKPAGALTAKLLVNATTTVWGTEAGKRFLGLHGEALRDYYAEVDHHGPAYFETMAWHAREEMYLLQVRVKTAGGWKTGGTIYGGGPMASTDKVYVIDVAGLPGETLTVRLRPPANFWRIDQLAVDYSSDAPVSVTEVEPTAPGDAQAPDIAERLRATDGLYLVMPELSQPVDVVFVPPAAGSPRAARTLILKASGYYDPRIETSGLRPRADILRRFATEPGATIRFAMDEYLEWKAEQDASQRTVQKHGN